jgi:hypothetical protein
MRRFKQLICIAVLGLVTACGGETNRADPDWASDNLELKQTFCAELSEAKCTRSQSCFPVYSELGGYLGCQVRQSSCVGLSEGSCLTTSRCGPIYSEVSGYQGCVTLSSGSTSPGTVDPG